MLAAAAAIAVYVALVACERFLIEHGYTTR
jgi:hypothetical protein